MDEYTHLVCELGSNTCTRVCVRSCPTLVCPALREFLTSAVFLLATSCHPFKLQRLFVWTEIKKSQMIRITFSNGSLGSRNDEERSEMRYVMWIADRESSNLWTHIALLLVGSMSVWVSAWNLTQVWFSYGELRGGLERLIFPKITVRNAWTLFCLAIHTADRASLKFSDLDAPIWLLAE